MPKICQQFKTYKQELYSTIRNTKGKWWYLQTFPSILDNTTLPRLYTSSSSYSQRETQTSHSLEHDPYTHPNKSYNFLTLALCIRNKSPCWPTAPPQDTLISFGRRPRTVQTLGKDNKFCGGGPDTDKSEGQIWFGRSLARRKNLYSGKSRDRPHMEKGFIEGNPGTDPMISSVSGMEKGL
jgi:hypothetical protein